MKKIILRLLILITLSKSSLYCSEDANHNDSMVYRFGRSYYQGDESPGGIFRLIFNSNTYFAADRIFREAATGNSMLNAFTGGRALNSLDWIKKNPKKFIGYSLGAIVAYDRASQSESLLNKFTRGTALYLVNSLKEKPGAFMAGATCLFLIGSAIASRYQPTDLEKSTQTDSDSGGFSVSEDSGSENSAATSELNSSDEESVSEDSGSENSAKTSELNSSNDEDELDNWSMWVSLN